MDNIALNITVSVVTSVLTCLTIEYFKRSGKISVHCTNTNVGLLKPDHYGGQEPTLFIDEAEELNISVSIDLYNSSQVTKSLREIGIELKPKRRYAFKLTPNVPNPEAKSGWNLYQSLKSINLPSRELIHLDLQCWDRHINNLDYKGDITISFVARHPNGLEFKSRLGTINLQKNFSGFAGR